MNKGGSNSTDDSAMIERSLSKDAQSIAKRALFGLVCGSLTGLCFGFVEVLRDTKAMTSKPKVATAKVMR
jgi:hypothetical protein